MAKTNLIGGALWEQYSGEVARRMNHPQFLGVITEEEAQAMGAELVIADWGAEACGDAVRLYWAVDVDTHVIKMAKFKSFGCGTAIASSDAMCELCVGKTVDDAMIITNIDVEHFLRDHDETPAVPHQKMHCSVMAYDVIKLAASLYKGVPLSEIEGEQVVCECARVTLATLKDVIRLNDLRTVEDIGDYTKAGTYCCGCAEPGGHGEYPFYLSDVLEEVRAEMEGRTVQTRASEYMSGEKRWESHAPEGFAVPVATGVKIAANPETKTFSEMSIVQKMKAIEKVLDVDIRPMLTADGGGLELTDLHTDSDFTYVYINYLGACVGCGAATEGTLQAIQMTLIDQLDPSIRVIPG